MKRLLAVALTCALLSACGTTTQIKLADAKAPKPASGTRILVLQPDIELTLLTASGVQEPRADWSKAAKVKLSADIADTLKGRTHQIKTADPAGVIEGREGQLFRLHEAVGNSILLFSYGGISLPSKKKDSFDWTLGEGAQTLGATYDADYALFVYGRGSYASGGRVALAIGMSLLGGSVPLGSQNAFASLVDLHTGRVVWFNVAHAGQNADMREDAGAKSLTASLLKDIPL